MYMNGADDKDDIKVTIVVFLQNSSDESPGSNTGILIDGFPVLGYATPGVYVVFKSLIEHCSRRMSPGLEVRELHDTDVKVSLFMILRGQGDLHIDWPKLGEQK